MKQIENEIVIPGWRVALRAIVACLFVFLAFVLICNIACRAGTLGSASYVIRTPFDVLDGVRMCIIALVLSAAGAIIYRYPFTRPSILALAAGIAVVNLDPALFGFDSILLDQVRALVAYPAVFHESTNSAIAMTTVAAFTRTRMYLVFYLGYILWVLAVLYSGYIGQYIASFALMRKQEARKEKSLYVAENAGRGFAASATAGVIAVFFACMLSAIVAQAGSIREETPWYFPASITAADMARAIEKAAQEKPELRGIAALDDDSAGRWEPPDILPPFGPLRPPSATKPIAQASLSKQAAAKPPMPAVESSNTTGRTGGRGAAPAVESSAAEMRAGAKPAALTVESTASASAPQSKASAAAVESSAPRINSSAPREVRHTAAAGSRQTRPGAASAADSRDGSGGAVYQHMERLRASLLLAAISFFVGAYIVGILVRPRTSTWVACGVIVAVMLLPALSILFFLPSEDLESVVPVANSGDLVLLAGAFYSKRMIAASAYFRLLELSPFTLASTAVISALAGDWTAKVLTKRHQERQRLQSFKDSPKSEV